MSGATERVPLPESEEQRLEEPSCKQEHFQAVIDSFLFYKQHALERVQRMMASYRRLSPDHQALLPKFLPRALEFRSAIDTNYDLVLKFAQSSPFGDSAQKADVTTATQRPRPKEMDMDKVYTTIKQLVRDWAAEGQAERDQCYKPIVDALAEYYPPDARPSISVCVPGAGLGRLAFEIARLGFSCQGNEWSVHMLLASHVMLNSQDGILHTRIYPWAHIFTNNYGADDQLQPILIPDVDPFDIPCEGRFSMAAGDFLEVYATPEQWDCVATCFFIDTARNIIVYIQRIFSMLRPGGLWLNFGPLLYHFDDNREAPSIELSFEEVRHIILAVGFEIMEERYPLPSGYICNPRSMLQMTYNCVLLRARKPMQPLSEDGEESDQRHEA